MVKYPLATPTSSSLTDWSVPTSRGPPHFTGGEKAECKYLYYLPDL